MMRKIYFTLILIVSFSYSGQAKNIVDYFVDMPSYLIPTFDSSFRLELSENYLNGTKDSLENANGKSVFVHEIDTLNHYLSIQVTSNTRLEIKLFFNENDTTIGVINTVCAPICSSFINFFDTKWNKKDISYPNLSIKNWIKAENQLIDETNVQDYFPASFIEYSFEVKNNNLTAKNNSLEFVNKTNKNLISRHLKGKGIILIWQNGKFQISDELHPNTKDQLK